MGRSFRIGLIGLGHWGKVFQKAIVKADGIELSAVCTSNPMNREILPKDARVFSNRSEFLDCREMDAVIVATPASTHAKILTEVMERKIPCLVEKPLTTSFSDAQELLKLESDSKALVLVDHIHLFNSSYLHFKSLVGAQINAGNEISKIVSRGGNHGPFRSDCSSLWDYGPHDLSMCFHLTSSLPDEIKCQLDEKKNFLLQMKLENGVGAEILVGSHFHEKARFFSAVMKDGHQLVFDDLDSDPVYELSRSRERRNFALPEAMSETRPLDNVLFQFRAGVQTGNGAAFGFGLKLGSEIVRVLEEAESQVSTTND